MENAGTNKGLLDRYQIESIFEGYEEYCSYLVKALATFQDLEKKRNPSLRAFVPEYLEIRFANIKAPRLFMPRYKGVIVVEIPQGKLSPRQRGVVRDQKLIEFAPLVKVNELASGDQFAMRMKLLNSGPHGKRGRKKRK